MTEVMSKHTSKWLMLTYTETFVNGKTTRVVLFFLLLSLSDPFVASDKCREQGDKSGFPLLRR